MFACTSSRAYVCLRCQHRAIRRDLKWLQIDQTPATHKRWQSAVARVRQDEDEDDFDGYVNPTTISEEPRTGTRFRHWRPSPTAKLGVDALGRPAEVLVLPNRRRKDQQADIEDEEDVSNKEERPRSKQPRILESITQETKPVSNDEAMANIEILKQEVGQVGGELRLRQWTKTREALSQGFTVRQLSNYYNVSANDTDKVQIGAHSRVELADKIISAVWKYTRKTQDKEAQVTKVFSNNYVKLFVVNQDLLKQQRTVLPGVKISKPQKSKRLEISGSVEAVNKTVEQLRRIENKVKQTTIPFPLEMKLALHDLMLSNGSRRSRPEDCMALRELLIESRIVLEASTKGDILKIYALDDATLGSFLQNLMRWIESTKRVFVTAPTSAHVLDDNCVVPVYSNGPYARNTVWYRYIEPGLESHRDLPALDYPSNVITETLMSEILAAKNDSLEYFVQSAIGHQVKHDNSNVSTELGLAIFQHQQSKEVTVSQSKPNEQQPEYQALKYLLDEHSKISASAIAKQLSSIKSADREVNALQSAFSGRIPLLPQFLGQQRPFTAPSTNETTSQVTTLQDESMSTFRLLYKSVDPQIPDLEISMSMNSDSTMAVKKVAFCVDDTQQNLILPHLAIDLNFTKKHDSVLFEHHTPLVPKFAPLMAQIAQYVNPTVHSDSDMEKHQTTDINPVINLDLSCLAIESNLNPEPQAQGLVTAIATTKPPAPLKLSKSTAYILTQAERVDRITYHPPLSSGTKSTPFLLEHVTYTPLPACPKQEARQALKVVEREPTPNTDDKEKLQVLAKEAYRTAVALDRFIAEKSGDIVKTALQREEQKG